MHEAALAVACCERRLKKPAHRRANANCDDVEGQSISHTDGDGSFVLSKKGAIATPHYDLHIADYHKYKQYARLDNLQLRTACSVLIYRFSRGDFISDGIMGRVRLLAKFVTKYSFRRRFSFVIKRAPRRLLGQRIYFATFADYFIAILTRTLVYTLWVKKRSSMVHIMLRLAVNHS